MLVRDVMSDRKLTIESDALLSAAARIMRDEDVGCLIVEDEGTLKGIITDRDIVCRGLASAIQSTELKIADVMTPDVVWCREEEDIEDAIRLMEDRQVRRLPVVNDSGETVGMVSLGDISTHLSHELSGEVVAAISSPRSVAPVAVSAG